MSNNQDELTRIYARIIAIREHLKDADAVNERFGTEYDALVERAASASGLDLSEFKIRDDYKIPHTLAYLPEGFLSRVDSLLGYLRSLMPTETVEKIGFR